MKVFKLAWRNVWRNQRRTFVTVAAMSLALLTMILYSGLFEGYLLGMERNILDLEVGEIQVYGSHYRKDPSLYEKIDDPEGVIGRLEQAGFTASPRLLGSGLGAAGETSAGVSFYGIEVERDARVSLIGTHVREGAWLDPADSSGVVIGRRLARILSVKPGDELVVLSQAADGSMANELYTVRGVLKGISDGVDRGGVFINAAAFRELFVFPEGAHQIIVRTPAEADLEQAGANARTAAPDLDVKTWRELVPTLASLLDATRGVMFAMFLIIYGAIAIVLLNAMLMAVFERVKEFGVLKAIGVGPAGVLSLIMLESAVQTVLALTIGVALSFPGLWYLTTHGIDLSGIGDISLGGIAWDPVWRAEVTASTYSGPIVTMVVIVTLAALYPAVRAAMIQPIEAMRHR